MRYGIISDIHGNLEALEETIKSLSREKIDKVLCAGDIVGYGADPAECIRKTNGLNPIIVCGNHDAACAGLTDIRYFNEVAREAVVWAQKNLNEKDLLFLRGLEFVYKNADLTMVHGTLKEPEMFHYMFDKNTAQATFDLLKTRVCFVAHSHVPGMFSYRHKKGINYFYKEKTKLAKDESMIVNVGSVGQPRDGDPRLCYCIYDTKESSIELTRLTYNVEKAQAKIINAGLPPVLARRLGRGM